MPPAPDYDALSDGSDLTGEDSPSDHQDENEDETMASAPRTPSKKRRRVVRTVVDEDDDEEDEDEVADALEDDDEDDADAMLEDEDELMDEDEYGEEYDAPSTSSRKGPVRSSGRKTASSRAAAATKRSSRASARAADPPTPATTGGKKSLRVKLTRTPQAASTAAPTTLVEDSSPAPKARPSRTTAAPTPPTRRLKDATKVKWKPRTSKSGGKDSSDEDEIPVPEDDELASDLDVSRAPTADALSGTDDDGSASEPDEATAAEMAAIMGKTARQLAREGGVESEHMELPMFDPNRKKKLTENEIALRRSETARKRKNQVEKKLEDDKVETINRLLKKQVGRSRNKLPKAGEEESDEEAEQARKRGREELSRKALKEMPAPFFRFIDRAEGKVLAVPSGPPLIEEVWGTNYVEVNQALVQELDTPTTGGGLSEKAKALEERARQRLAKQAEQWKEDQALEEVWGQEGLYEYKLRSALGQTRKEWIGSRRAPTPKVEEQPEEKEQQEEHEEQEEEEAEAEGDHEEADEAESK